MGGAGASGGADPLRVNHLGPYLLTRLLLRRSSMSCLHARPAPATLLDGDGRMDYQTWCCCFALPALAVCR